MEMPLSGICVYNNVFILLAMLIWKDALTLSCQCKNITWFTRQSTVKYIA